MLMKRISWRGKEADVQIRVFTNPDTGTVPSHLHTFCLRVKPSGSYCLNGAHRGRAGAGQRWGMGRVRAVSGQGERQGSIRAESGQGQRQGQGMVGAGQYQSGVKAISGQGQRRGKAEAGQNGRT